MKKLLTVSVTALLLSGGAAFAADAIMPMPIVAVVAPVYDAGYSWEGAYAGIYAGYGWGSVQDTNNPQADKKNTDGWLGGATVGYNWQLDNIVLGIEGDIGLADIKNRWEGRATNQYNSYYTEDKITAQGSLRARLGFAADGFMPYITGGLAGARTSHVLGCDPALVTATNGCGTPFEDKGENTIWGWTAGVGAEMAVAENITMKVEYLYTAYESDKVTLTDPNAPTNINNRTFDTSTNTVKLGLNFRF